MDKHLRPSLIVCFVVMIMVMTSCKEKQQTLNIAVASNFEKTLSHIVKLYQQQSNEKYNINIIAASSGVLSAQIENHAPFDLFLSADTQKPQHLATKFKPHQPIIYAIGQLALWIPHTQDDTQCLDKLNDLETLAIANPKTAPYGELAQQIIHANSIKIKKIIHTASVAQAYLYTQQNLTQAGFVPYSLLKETDQGCIQIFQHQQLSQSMLLLNDKASALYAFILSDKIQQFIQQSGYAIP